MTVGDALTIFFKQFNIFHSFGYKVCLVTKSSLKMIRHEVEVSILIVYHVSLKNN